MAKLGDYIEQIRGVSYKPTDLHDSLKEESVTLLRANNIQDGHIAVDEVVYVAKNKVVAKQYLKKGDILICTSSGSKELVGKAAYIEENMPMTFGAFCKVIRPKTECPKYIGHFFQSPYYRRCISDLSAGANINNIRNEHIEGLEIPLPPLDEQRRIATVLDKVSGLIAKRREQLDKLDELVKARFVEMSANWKGHSREEPMSNYLEDITYGFTNPMPDADEGPWKITAKDIVDGKINYSTARKTDRKAFENLTAKSKPVIGDVLLTKDGTLGRVAVVEQGNICVNQSVAVLRCNKRILPKFLMYLLKMPQYQREMLANSGGGTIKHIYITKVDKMLIAVPELDSQKEFIDFTSQIDKSKLTIQQSLDKLEVLKKALMQQYFG